MRNPEKRMLVSVCLTGMKQLSPRGAMAKFGLHHGFRHKIANARLSSSQIRFGRGHRPEHHPEHHSAHQPENHPVWGRLKAGLTLWAALLGILFRRSQKTCKTGVSAQNKATIGTFFTKNLPYFSHKRPP
jgi:hypothetical protein